MTAVDGGPERLFTQVKQALEKEPAFAGACQAHYRNRVGNREYESKRAQTFQQALLFRFKFLAFRGKQGLMVPTALPST